MSETLTERTRTQLDGEPPLKEGWARARLILDRSPEGFWLAWSPEWRGLHLANSDLGKLLSVVPEGGKVLLQAMQEWQNEKREPVYGPKQLDQMQVYETFFGELDT